MPFPFFNNYQTPRLFAHRGASGYRPENTLEAFALGLEMGAAYLELDVRMTRDCRVVVIHDRDVRRTTEGRGAVDEMVLREVQRLDAGYRFRPEAGADHPYRGRGIRIPTLEEVLESFPSAMLNIEVKQAAPPMEPVLESVLVRCSALDRVLLAAKQGQVMERIQERFGARVATGISWDEGVRLSRWILSGRRGEMGLQGQALQIPDRLKGVDYINAALIDLAHRLGLEVHVWTVNDPERMRQLLDMGADGIMTDFPDRFMSLQRKGPAF